MPRLKGYDQGDLRQYLKQALGADENWRGVCDEADQRSAEQSHSPREILQQPWVWRASAELVCQTLPSLEGLLDDVDQVYLTGAGSSYYVGKCLEPALRTRLARPVSSVPSTDLILAPEDLLARRGKGLVVSFSRSGRSPESFEVARAVSRHYPEYRQLLITCNPESELTALYSDLPDGYVLGLHPASCDRGLAMTSSFTSMVLAGQSLAFLNGCDEYRAHVSRLAGLAIHVLSHSVASVAGGRLGQLRRVCLLGNGSLYGSAQEGALKILEMTDGRISTISEGFLGVRHGPLSFVDSETLVVYMISSDKLRRRYELDLMQELWTKGLGGHRIALGFGLGDLQALAEESIDLANFSPDDTLVDDDLRPPVDILLPQVLALRLSLEHGFNPDNPSSRGAISRVVQGVTIH